MAAETSSGPKGLPGLAIDQRLLLPTPLSTTSDPSWTLILVLTCLPVFAPFALVCWTCLVVRERVAGPKNCCLRLVLSKKCCASCVCGSAACLATPCVLASGVLCGPVSVLAEWGTVEQTSIAGLGPFARRRCMWLCCSWLLGLSVAPVFALVLLCGVLLAPPCGLILCVLKLAGCWKPQVQTNITTTP